VSIVTECSEFRELSAEFALGVLDARERALVVAHLERCDGCRKEVREFAGIADGLASLAPLVEPPNGFESRVLESVRAMRHGRAKRNRRRAPLLAIAAAVIVVAGFVGWTLRSGNSNSSVVHAQLTSATLASPRRVVGEVVIDRAGSWVSMAVDLPETSVWATCEVITGSGSVVIVGSFRVVHGHGYWAAPLHRTMTIDGARLVDYSGRTLASSTFAAVRVDGAT
jgi:predicted anti-sigma-YlaC factor YlaD